MDLINWLMKREAGFTYPTADREFVLRNVYKSLNVYNTYSDIDSLDDGALYNLEFSEYGKILSAASRNNSVLLFDTVTQELIRKVSDAHLMSVNNIKFLDSNVFATCSDDATVALWDLRNLDKKLRVLHGHSNCVKDIEYYKKENLLITSSFDGNIFTWDVKSETEQSLVYQKVFHLSGLMRCSITSDFSKMVLTTTGGYILIIHDLNLSTLHNDLNGFKPSIYRLMQMGNQYIPQAAKYDHVFLKSQKRNRIQIIDDFPENDVAEIIKSLQIHPSDQCILTRNRTSDELDEFTCVHSLQDEPRDGAGNDNHEPCAKRQRSDSLANEYRRPTLTQTQTTNPAVAPVTVSQTERSSNRITHDFRVRHSTPILAATFLLANRLSPPSPPPTPNAMPSRTGRLDSFIPDIWAAEVTVQDRCMRQNRPNRNPTPVSGYNFVYAINSGVLPPPQSLSARPNHHQTHSTSITTRTVPRDRPLRSMTASLPVTSTLASDRQSGSPSPSSSLSTSTAASSVSSAYPITQNTMKRRNIIFQNPKKLVYYVKDCSELTGIIREPCFSADGRIICSPYGNGVRLYGYNPQCTEYPNQVKYAPKQLTEVKQMSDHPSVVLCSKFSPIEPILVTGCNYGKLLWYRPHL